MFEATQSAGFGGIRTPRRAAGNTPILTSGILQAAEMAIRAETSIVEPITVRIEGVFGLAFADLNAVARREVTTGMIPGRSFHAQKIDIHRIGGVCEQRMG